MKEKNTILMSLKVQVKAIVKVYPVNVQKNRNPLKKSSTLMKLIPMIKIIINLYPDPGIVALTVFLKMS
jgi:hypothetical protein